MAEQKLVVADGVVVSLDYTLRLDDGEVIDTSDGQEPLLFMQGVGQIIPGLEKVLYEMAVGDEKEAVVAPAEGYGEMNPDAFEMAPREIFPSDMELTEGLELHLQDQDGQIVAASVAEIHSNGVLLDFNHPLAGETLHFQVKIVDLRPATAEEKAHGHAHGSHSHAH